MDYTLELVRIKNRNWETSNKNFQLEYASDNQKTASEKDLEVNARKTADLTSLTERNWQAIKNNLGLPEIPSLYKLRKEKALINDNEIFALNQNLYGFFLAHPQRKLEFVLEKLQERSPTIFPTDTIIIKIGGDGKNINSAHIKILNMVFTVPAETAFCKNAKGNYILGIKFFLYFNCLTKMRFKL